MQPFEIWLSISHFGNSLVLLPMALVITGTAAKTHGIRAATLWAIGFGSATTLVLVSKLLFLGWGLGIEPLDFTGFSGHAMLSAAVLPSLGLVWAWETKKRIRTGAVATGCLLAILIGLSRLTLQYHSVSEVLTGWLLGGGVFLAFLRCRRPTSSAAFGPKVHLAPGMLLFAILLISTAPQNGQPGPETHGLVVRLALWASGRAEPFTRQDMHRQAADKHNN